MNKISSNKLSPQNPDTPESQIILGGAVFVLPGMAKWAHEIQPLTISGGAGRAGHVSVPLAGASVQSEQCPTATDFNIEPINAKRPVAWGLATRAVGADPTIGPSHGTAIDPGRIAP